jgi:hypothetical protein
MTTPLHSRILDPVRVAVRLVAMVAVVFVLTQGVAAQDTDDDGVLPATGSETSGDEAGLGSGGSGGGSGGQGSQGLEMIPAVTVAGELQDEIDPAVASLEFAAQTPGAVTELLTEVPADEAAFVAQPPVVAAGENGTGQVLQGSGLLHLPEGLQAHFAPAQAASKRLAFIVLAKDGPSLQAELAGAAKPQLVIPISPTGPIDLVKLSALMTKYANVLAGYHATIVFASVDAGELHVSAVRAHTDGGPLEVLLR